MEAQGLGFYRGRLVFWACSVLAPVAAPDTPFIRALRPLPGPFPRGWGLGFSARPFLESRANGEKNGFGWEGRRLIRHA